MITGMAERLPQLLRTHHAALKTAWLRRLPGSVRSVPGLEWMILRRMPRAVALATAAPLLIALLAIGLHDADTALAFERFRSDVTILLIAVLATLWTAAFTLAIGCLIVVVMKGPAYVADAYELRDAESPDARHGT